MYCSWRFKMMSVAPASLEAHSDQDTLYHCMKDYKHGPNSRMSITFNSSKGLTNAPGQNNCFLNSAVQVMNYNVLSIWTLYLSLAYGLKQLWQMIKL